MSRLTGREPKHWHDAQGRHRMTDPRALDWWQLRFADADEKRYVEHLEAHEDEALNPEPRPDDTPKVQALFEHIESLEAMIRVERSMITALRKQGLTPEPDETEPKPVLDDASYWVYGDPF